MKRGASSNKDPKAAVAELAEQIRLDEPAAAIIFFCSAEYDPEVVAEAIGQEFACPSFGCTSAGEICEQYQSEGIVGLSLPGSDFCVSSRLIESIDQYTPTQAEEILKEMKEELPSEAGTSRFALCLIDGLSVQEESFVANTFGALAGIPLVGGSAGDSLKFERTAVFKGTKHASNAAILALVDTKFDVEIFQLRHFEPSESEVVITSADPATRIVYEIDGGPAAEEYANLLGVEVEALNPDVFSASPVMLQMGSDWYVRSIQQANPDNSLTFYCAIDEGIPLTLGRGENFIENLQERVTEIQSQFSEIELTLGFDCILRRLEIQQKELQSQVESILGGVNFVGFSTFGEQVNGVHVNQTLTGVVLGRKA